MICPKCGANTHDEAKFCPKCGADLQSNAPLDDGLTQPNAQQPYGSQQYNNRQYSEQGQYGGQQYNNQQYNGQQQYGGQQQFDDWNAHGGGYVPPKEKKNVNLGVILGIVISSVIIFILAVVVVYMAWTGTGFFADKSEPSPTPAATVMPVASPTPMPTPSPVPTEMPTLPPVVLPTQTPFTGNNSSSGSSSYTAAVANPKYTTFKSDAYGFSCSYPSHFQVYNDGGTLTLWTGCTSDGRAREIIVATPVGNETVNSSFNTYTSSHRGSITYQTKGSDYYAVCINDGTTEYYKYCKFKNGNMYWFEFISPHSEHAIYDIYINDIYNSMDIK